MFKFVGHLGLVVEQCYSHSMISRKLMRRAAARTAKHFHNLLDLDTEGLLLAVSLITRCCGLIVKEPILFNFKTFFIFSVHLSWAKALSVEDSSNVEHTLHATAFYSNLGTQYHHYGYDDFGMHIVQLSWWDSLYWNNVCMILIISLLEMKKNTVMFTIQL